MSSRATYGVDTISKLLLLTPRRIQQLVREGVLPRSERGRYELVPVVQAYVGYLKDRTIGTEVNVISLDEARQRKLAAKAELAEILLREKTNELVSLDLVRMVWEELISTSRARLLSLPAKIAPVVAVEDDANICKQLVEEAVNEALYELEHWVDSFAAENPTADGDAEMGTPTEANSESVGGQPPETVA